ncbi:MAG TPA: HD domain-containing phosphohydrolase [Gaiellaceae bacterium]|jgi:ribonuclease P protein subunit RPR2|nr:HD domain-containing phosphohydrolase [Gaiellaceae bacterium]
MPTWIEWAVVGAGIWLFGGTALAFGVARVFAFAGAGDSEHVLREDPGPAGQRLISLRTQVLVVDDDAPLRSLLRATLAAEEFDVREAGSAEEAVQIMRAWRPELVLLDVNLPRIDGLTLCAELVRSHSELSVILLTGEDVGQTTARLAGANGVVRKPFSPLELLDLIGRVLDGREFVSAPPTADEGQLLTYARDLASIAQSERRQRKLLQDAYQQTAVALADAVDVRDRATGLHAQRVRRYAIGLAGAVDPLLLDDPSLEYGFLLHDVGKIGIADQILLKPGPLTDAEHELVRLHPAIGAQILQHVALLQGSGLDVVRHHHERWDGAGYPDRLSGEDIPLSARIFAVADTLDAMTSDRPYRRAVRWDDAVDEIVAQSGRQFDPEVVQAFVDAERELRAVYEELSLVA